MRAPVRLVTVTPATAARATALREATGDVCEAGVIASLVILSPPEIEPDTGAGTGVGAELAGSDVARVLDSVKVDLAEDA
jgi:hypothetical protein